MSLACQARCLAQAGEDGAVSYARAGLAFLEAGDRAIREDPRQALHLYDRARACFERARDLDAARRAEDLCASLRRALDVTAAYR